MLNPQIDISEESTPINDKNVIVETQNKYKFDIPQDNITIIIGENDNFIAQNMNGENIITFNITDILSTLEHTLLNPTIKTFIEKYICTKENNIISITQSQLTNDIEFLITLNKILRKNSVQYDTEDFLYILTEYTINLIANKSYELISSTDEMYKNKLIKYSTGLVYFSTQHLQKYIKLIESKYDGLYTTMTNIKETIYKLEKNINKM
jgi:hypothetical protein